MTTISRRVASQDGVRLAVYESGARHGRTVVAVHGYPDNHAVWDRLVAELATDFHVVTYDVRGAGESDKPSGRRAYRMPHLVDDLAAVVVAVSPDRPVHLIGHDWGSIQAWPALNDPRLAGRIAGFTSISGPSLDYAIAWLRRSATHPRAALRQLAHSYYLALFQLPGLPELAIRRGLFDRVLPAAEPAPSTADMLHGLQLYRANMLGRAVGPRPRPTRTPVQLIVPKGDAFVTPDLAVAATRPWVPELSVHRVDGGHWIVSERPGIVAGLLRDFVDQPTPPRR